MIIVSLLLYYHVEILVGDLQFESPDSAVPSPDIGLYIASQPFAFNGRLKSLRACGFLLDPNPNPQGTDKITLSASIAIFRRNGNNLKRMNPPDEILFQIDRNDTFGCVIKNYADIVRPHVSKGDYAGLFARFGGCVQVFLDPEPLYVCPAQLNMIDPVNNCSQVLHFNSTRFNINMPMEVNIVDGYPANVIINVEGVIGKPISVVTIMRSKFDKLLDSNLHAKCITVLTFTMLLKFTGYIYYIHTLTV